jgi:hypothetical protein
MKKMIMFILCLMTLSVFSQTNQVNKTELLQRIEHIQRLVIKNNAYYKTSIIGGRMVELKSLIRRDDIDGVIEALDYVESQLKKYNMWEE